MLFNFLANIEMFSLAHIMAVVTTLAIIVVVFFCRKFFINNKKADFIFRLVLGLLLIYSEFQIRFDSCFGNAPVVIRNIPIPLCGMLLWIASIGIISDSERIMKKFLPIFLTAATLSLIMCEISNCTIWDFRYYQYFICHGGFLLGALYFVFTRKINKFNFKDYGWSCLIIGAIGGVMSFLFATNRNFFPDDLYVMGFGMDVFKPIYDAVGQIGYSLIYMGSIAIFMLIFTTILYFATKHRDNKSNSYIYKQNKFLDTITYKINHNGRKAIVATLVIAMLYLMAWQSVMAHVDLNGSQVPPYKYDPLIIGLGWFIGVIWFVTLTCAIFNEMAHYYELQNKNN